MLLIVCGVGISHFDIIDIFYVSVLMVVGSGLNGGYFVLFTDITSKCWWSVVIYLVMLLSYEQQNYVSGCL